MVGREGDPWTLWYDAYLGQRAALKAAGIVARERRRANNLLASLAVGLVMAN